MRQLRVIHQLKGSQADPTAVARVRQLLPGDVFDLDSCQRQLWACWESDLPEDLTGFDVFEGEDAYRFLLRVATGLESQIVGETDIFGQLREVWRKADQGAAWGTLMQAVFKQLFEDTKDVRARYLQNLGGASYGSLARQMLKQVQGPVLIVGAGQLAESVAPFFEQVLLSNRSLERAMDLAAKLPQARVTENWDEAKAAVFCVPLDAQGVARWRAGGAERPVIHLGGHRADAGEWRELPDFRALDDVFALQKSQGDVRALQVQQAARACDEKAKLRSLGASVTMPHGWEDLAVFA